MTRLAICGLLAVTSSAKKPNRMKQLFPAPNVLGHRLRAKKSSESLPETEVTLTLEIERGAAPIFFTVTNWKPKPGTWKVPKLTFAGVAVACAPGTTVYFTVLGTRTVVNPDPAAGVPGAEPPGPEMTSPVTSKKCVPTVEVSTGL